MSFYYFKVVYKDFYTLAEVSFLVEKHLKLICPLISMTFGMGRFEIGDNIQTLESYRERLFENSGMGVDLRSPSVSRPYRVGSRIYGIRPKFGKFNFGYASSSDKREPPISPVPPIRGPPAPAQTGPAPPAPTPPAPTEETTPPTTPVPTPVRWAPPSYGIPAPGAGFVTADYFLRGEHPPRFRWVEPGRIRADMEFSYLHNSYHVKRWQYLLGNDESLGEPTFGIEVKNTWFGEMVDSILGYRLNLFPMVKKGETGRNWLAADDNDEILLRGAFVKRVKLRGFKPIDWEAYVNNPRNELARVLNWLKSKGVQTHQQLTQTPQQTVAPAQATLNVVRGGVIPKNPKVKLRPYIKDVQGERFIVGYKIVDSDIEVELTENN